MSAKREKATRRNGGAVSIDARRDQRAFERQLNAHRAIFAARSIARARRNRVLKTIGLFALGIVALFALVGWALE